MKSSLCAILLCIGIVAAACSDNRPKQADGVTERSRTPVSVRGWISDIDTGESAVYRVNTLRNARLMELLQQSNVSVENAPYVSGGLGETGAFIILDVPHGTAELLFQAPGVPGSKLRLANIPPNADVLLPRLILSPTGVLVADPTAIRVRVAGAGAQRRKLPQKANVGPHQVEIWEVPLSEMEDRRDYPTATSGEAPLATVK